MRLLEERIRADGEVLDGDVLRVDSFLNHQLDPDLLTELGREFYRLFAQEGVTKLLTVEALARIKSMNPETGVEFY